MTGMQDSSRKNRHQVACFFRTPTGCRYPPPQTEPPVPTEKPGSTRNGSTRRARELASVSTNEP